MFAIDKSVAIIIGMIIGAISIYLGYKLFIKGIDGSSTFEGEIQQVKLTLRNAAPGLFFALFGSIIIATGIFKKDFHYEYYENKAGEKFVNITEKSEKEDNINDLFNVAVRLEQNNHVEDSRTVYQAILLMNNKNHMAHNNLAIIYLSIGDKNKALSHAKEALIYGENSEYIANYYDTTAKIYFELKDFGNSQMHIKKALELKPNNMNYKDFLRKILETELIETK